jgi:septum formation protein
MLHSTRSAIPHRISSMYSVLLGSGSRTRREILTAQGIDFTIVKADIDEKALGDRSHGADPVALVTQLAHAKADAILKSLPRPHENKLLVTADTVVVHEGKILEKPHNLEEARKFIDSYRNNCCSVVGSIVLTDLETSQRVAGTETATIHFNHFPDEIIQRILDEGEVIHCAGGLMVEHELLQPYIHKMDGTQDALMGLSIDLLNSLFDELLGGKKLQS